MKPPRRSSARPPCIQTSPSLLLLLLLRHCSFCGAQPVPITQTGRRALSSIFPRGREKYSGHQEEYHIFLKCRIQEEIKQIYFHGVLEALSTSWVALNAPREVRGRVLFLYYSSLIHRRKETIRGGFIFERTFLIFALSSTKIFLKAKRIFIYIYLLNLMIYCDSPFHLFFP